MKTKLERQGFKSAYLYLSFKRCVVTLSYNSGRYGIGMAYFTGGGFGIDLLVFGIHIDWMKI